MRLAAYGRTQPDPFRPIASDEIRPHITDQCAVFARPEDDFRVDMLVAKGEVVRQGAPILRSRRNPELVLVAPVAAEIAAIDLGPGRRLSQVTFFHKPGAGRHEHDVSASDGGSRAEGIRAALLAAGLWTSIRSRPFGRLPAVNEHPEAIAVMATDTRPGAPPPRISLEGREEDFERGLRALRKLSRGQVAVFHDGSEPAGTAITRDSDIRSIKVSAIHPNGLAGLQIARHFPAEIGRPVWEIHAEDVAGIGAFLASGMVPETRLVAISGTALRETRLVRCQPGADLRALTFDIAKPGPHRLVSGSALDGVEGRWLGNWRRQVTALGSPSAPEGSHWFPAALKRASRPLPIIPTAALDQSLGGHLPAVPLVRAIASNDAESARRFGALSLIEDDIALADYVTSASPRLTSLLRSLLDRVQMEEAE